MPRKERSYAPQRYRIFLDNYPQIEKRFNALDDRELGFENVSRLISEATNNQLLIGSAQHMYTEIVRRGFFSQVAAFHFYKFIEDNEMNARTFEGHKVHFAKISEMRRYFERADNALDEVLLINRALMTNGIGRFFSKYRDAQLMLTHHLFHAEKFFEDLLKLDLKISLGSKKVDEYFFFREMSHWWEKWCEDPHPRGAIALRNSIVSEVWIAVRGLADDEAVRYDAAWAGQKFSRLHSR